MSEQIEQALKSLRDVLQAEAHKHCVCVNVFFNGEGYGMEYKIRAPDSLKSPCINMRNLRGEYIK